MSSDHTEDIVCFLCRLRIHGGSAEFTRHLIDVHGYRLTTNNDQVRSFMYFYILVDNKITAEQLLYFFCLTENI